MLACGGKIADDADTTDGGATDAPIYCPTNTGSVTHVVEADCATYCGVYRCIGCSEAADACTRVCVDFLKARPTSVMWSCLQCGVAEEPKLDLRRLACSDYDRAVMKVSFPAGSCVEACGIH